MTTTTKILLAIIATILISAGGFIIYQQYMFKQQALEIQNSVIEMKRLQDEIVRSQSQYVNQKGFEDFVKQNQVNLEGIQKDINSLGGKISAINVVVATSKSQNGNNVPSTGSINNPTPVTIGCVGNINCVSDRFNYFRTTQSLDLKESFGEKEEVLVPIGNVEFFAGTNDNKPWSYKILPRQYTINNTIAHTGDGQTIVYNGLTIKSGNESYTVPISSSQTVERYPSATFSWFNPRLALGFSGAASISNSSVKAEATPSLSVSIMSYGKTKIGPDIRVLSLGVGYNLVDRKPAVEISPIQFNVGKAVSGTLLNNLYVGPTLGVNTGGSFQIGLGMQVGL